MRWVVLACIAALVGCGSTPNDPIDPSGVADASTPDAPEWDVAFSLDTAFPSPEPFASGLQLGPTLVAARPPPPISGGTLIVARDGKTAVAADPDRDRVYLVDVAEGKLLSDVALKMGDEPGRVVEDDRGRVHVVLRSAGAIATIDLASRTLVARTPVCQLPRGIAFDAEKARLVVACAGGELVFDPLGTKSVKRIDRDLRDVLVSGSRRWVTRLKTAEVLELDVDGNVIARRRLPTLGTSPAPKFAPAVAFRAVVLGEGRLLIAHQRANRSTVSTFSGGYVGTCGPVHSTVSLLDDGAPVVAPPIDGAVLPLDVAVSPDGKSAAMVAAGGARVIGGAQLFRMPLSSLGDSLGDRGCGAPMHDVRFAQLPGQAIAVAFAPSGRLLVQSREPAHLMIDDRIVVLSSESRFDTGHLLFHAASGARGGMLRGGIACASCHPEGGDDGLVWDFQDIGKRRTQTFRGGLTGTEPFHWDGSLADLSALSHEVFHRRMGGPLLEKDQVAALARWIDAIPRLPPTAAAPEAIARGQALFAADSQGCATCHSGPRLTNNATVDVGTGGKLQVPGLLGVSWHPPFMHDGCAATLSARFVAPCGGGDAHGKTSHLSPAQLSDLVSYLESL